MKKLVVIFLMLVFCMIAVMFFLCMDANAFDKKLPEKIELDTSFLVHMKTMGEAVAWVTDSENNWIAKKGTFFNEGTGFVLLPGYIATAAHVICGGIVQVETGESVSWLTDVSNTIWKKMYASPEYAFGRDAIPLEEIYCNEETDIALLKYDLKAYKYAFDSSAISISITKTFFPYTGEPINLLQSKDKISMVSFKRDENDKATNEVEIRHGVVVSTEIISHEAPKTWFSMEDFTMFMDVYPGDSGSPIIAWDQGNPIIVGIARACEMGMFYVRPDGYSYAVRIDGIHRMVPAKK